METETIRLVTINKTSKANFTLFKVAAAIIVLCIVTVTVYFMLPAKENPNELLSISTNDKSLEQKLPDGSIVTVNPNSNFVALHKSKREYRLTGNAYFDVKHDDANPFIIHVNNLLIKDIGTSFSVEGNPKEDVVRIHVTQGIVQLYTMNQKGVTLYEGESGVYYKSMDVFEKIKPLNDMNSQTLSINFENEKLETVVDVLQKRFAVKINFANNKIKKCSISVKFDGSNLEEIIGIITETLDLWSTKENNIITLGGDGCGR